MKWNTARLHSFAWKALLLAVAVGLVSACAPAAPSPAATSTAPPATLPTAAPPAATSQAATPKPPEPTPTPRPTVKRGGTLWGASSSGYRTLDPHLSTTDLEFFSAMFDSLLRYDLVDPKEGRFELKPGVATSWELTDPKTIVMKLRSGIKFHDGSDLNADVVKWNLDRMRTEPKVFAKQLVEPIASVDRVDDNTIRINLKAPSAIALINLTPGAGSGGYMVSKQAVEKMGLDAFGRQAVGSGPFKLAEWLPDDRITLKRSDNYWGVGADGKPLPYLDGIVFRYITDPAVTLVEMKAGTVDVTTKVDGKDIASVKANPDLVYWELPWAGLIQFTMGFNPKREPFGSNLKLRQATLYALDREGMAKAIGFGVGRAACNPFTAPGFLGYSKDLPCYQFDPAKAQQLLSEAGYPNGIDANLIAINRPTEMRLAEIVKAMWDKVGIRTTVDVLERMTWIDRSQSQNFEINFWQANLPIDPELYRRVYTCNMPNNYSGWCDPELDRLHNQGVLTYDRNERQRAYEAVHKRIYETASHGSGMYMPFNVVYNKSVKGLKVQWWMLDMQEAWLDK